MTVKQKPKELDWVKEFYDKFVDTVHSIVDPTYSSEQVLSSPKRLTDFISKTLQQQREDLIKEIDGIVGEDEKLKYGRAGAVGKTIRECELFHFGEKAGRNQLRKEIRERLLLIK